MSKIGLIIQREYVTRVKKRTFIIMTIIGPILFAALMIAPAMLAQMEEDDLKYIAVIDDSYIFSPITSSDGTKKIEFLKNTDYIKFEFFQNYGLDSAKNKLKDSKYYALLYIPKNVVEMGQGDAQFFSYNQPNMGITMHIANCMEKQVENIKLLKKGDELGIDKNDIQEILAVSNSRVDIRTFKLGEGGEQTESSAGITMILGYISGFLIYMFIFMYGSQVMRGVIEEKTSRIVEVIVSSVKPFQLMMGKIVGVALVGLTQFLLWVVLTFGLVTVAQAIFIDKSKIIETAVPGSNLTQTTLADDEKVTDEGAAVMAEMFNSIKSINFPLVLGMFLFYFIGGYLLYAAMFAAIGSAVDNETDTQQFMLPVTIPLVLAIVVMVSAIKNPDSSLAFWFSMIPFTSPILMMVRIPFGVPIEQILASMALLVVTFIFMVWLAAKIYRTGILMYGKKVNYRELWKWIRYKS